MCVTQSSTPSPSWHTQMQLFAFAMRRNYSLHPYLLAAPTPCACDVSIISLRLLALILCSNCSNTFNKVLTSTWGHIVKLLFANLEHHFSLLNMHHGWSKHFTSRYDPSTPLPPHPPPPPNTPSFCTGTILLWKWWTSTFLLIMHASLHV